MANLREEFLDQWKSLKEKIKILSFHPEQKTLLLNNVKQWLTTNYQGGKNGLTSLEKQRADIIKPYLSETDFHKLKELEEILKNFVENIWNVAAQVRESKILWKLTFYLELLEKVK